MGLNKREIVIIAETNRDNYSVEIKTLDSRLWQAVITITQPKKHYDVFTARGALKTWTNLADAIVYIQETCDDCKNVTIRIGAWTFSRVI
ncbi:hypothetical protein LT85_p029 (plasmid) [Collimonas arenae]|uniref:Uncharacterized protein n=1 Tax=Collimonas arenae TaxID=279058 RepID=A0A0A1FHG3_9BURK|nr:hypothetical protein LT85_p029 [Collimonas arenae]